MSDERCLALRELSARREKAIDRLSEAFAHDDLDVEEFERRVGLAQLAHREDELDQLVADLPAPEAAVAPVPHMSVIPAAQAPAEQEMSSIMGNSERKGAWAVPRSMRARAIMGTIVLDFREARFPSGAVDLSVRCVLGDVTIIVPPQLAVETSGSNFMGNFEHVDRSPTDPDPDAPVLRVHGSTVMGNVSVRMRLPGEDWRDKWRRRSDERRERRLQHEAAREERRRLRAHRRDLPDDPGRD